MAITRYYPLLSGTTIADPYPLDTALWTRGKVSGTGSMLKELTLASGQASTGGAWNYIPGDGSLDHTDAALRLRYTNFGTPILVPGTYSGSIKYALQVSALPYWVEGGFAIQVTHRTAGGLTVLGFSETPYHQPGVDLPTSDPGNHILVFEVAIEDLVVGDNEDRIVIEIGGKCSWETTQAVSFRDGLEGADLPDTDGALTSGGRSWVDVDLVASDLPPEPPINLSVYDTTGTTASLIWNESTIGSSVLSFEYSLDGETPIDIGLDDSITFTDLLLSTEYVFQVRSVGVGGVSTWSEITLTTTEGPPLPPTGLVLSDITNVGGTAHWVGPVTDPERVGYEYHVVGFFVESAGFGAETRSFGDLNSSTDYVFEVRSIGELENSAWVQAPFTTLGPPEAPTDLEVSNLTGTSAQFDWVASPTATGYEYRINEGFAEDLGLVTTVTVGGLPPEAALRFDIRAVNDYGNSSWIILFFDTSIGIPEQPLGLHVSSITPTSFTANWMPPTTGSVPTGYQYSFDDAAWVDIPDVLSLTIDDLIPGTEHTLRVRSKNAAGTSVLWDSLAFALNPGPAHAPISLTESQVTETGAKVQWESAISGPPALYYEYSLNYSTVLNGGLAKQVVFENLQPGSVFNFRVRAVGEFGESDWSIVTFTTFTVEEPPVETRRIQWSSLGKRYYEHGLDRGVLYLSPDSGSGSGISLGVAWNGLTALDEDLGDESTEPLYMDGEKYLDAMSMGDFSGSLRAIIYPDEFMEYEGFVDMGSGVYADDQEVKVFGLSYRTLIGNDINGDDFGYKIHIVYNLTATPDPKSHATISSSTSLSEFGWAIRAVPELISGHRPTAHIMIDSRYMNRIILSGIEDILYGSERAPARLPSIEELIAYVNDFQFIEIIDNGDGTWTARGPDEMIQMINDTSFVIRDAHVVYLDEDTYTISDS